MKIKWALKLIKTSFGFVKIEQSLTVMEKIICGFSQRIKLSLNIRLDFLDRIVILMRVKHEFPEAEQRIGIEITPRRRSFSIFFTSVPVAGSRVPSLQYSEVGGWNVFAVSVRRKVMHGDLKY